MDPLEIPMKWHLFVVVDYYSTWPEIALLTKTDVAAVIKCLESMFRSHGLPEALRSDMAHCLLYENLKDSLSTWQSTTRKASRIGLKMMAK